VACIRANAIAILYSGRLLMMGRRSNCDSGEPDLYFARNLVWRSVKAKLATYCISVAVRW
jgi:hypothetical protein